MAWPESSDLFSLTEAWNGKIRSRLAEGGRPSQYAPLVLQEMEEEHTRHHRGERPPQALALAKETIHA